MRPPESRDEKVPKKSVAPSNVPKVQNQEEKRSERGLCVVHGQTPEAAICVSNFVFLFCNIAHLSCSSSLPYTQQSLLTPLVSIARAVPSTGKQLHKMEKLSEGRKKPLQEKPFPGRGRMCSHFQRTPLKNDRTPHACRRFGLM